MTHRHHTTGRLCNCGFTKHLRKPQASRPSKFFTDERQHVQNKARYNMRWGFPPKKSAADPEFLEQYIREHGPYMYHGTTPEAAKQIVKEGLYPHDHDVSPSDTMECGQCGNQIATLRDGNLEPTCANCGMSSRYAVPRTHSRSNYNGFLEPRSDHVYLGDYETAGRYAPNHTTPMLRIDLRKLDPHQMSADEDHFQNNPYNINAQPIHPIVDKVHEYEAPPDPDYYEPGGQTLGQWADQIGLGNEPEETHHSMRQGSMAYNGVVPPEAIEMDTVHRGWGGIAPKAETGWKAMPKDDYVAQPFVPSQPPPVGRQDDLPNMWDIGAKPTRVFAATDSNHWEGKMWHGNNQGLLGAVRTPFWTTSHKPEAEGFGDTVHPVSVRFKRPYWMFGDDVSREAIADAMDGGHDGIVLKRTGRDPVNWDPEPYPDRDWAIALDPGTVVPGHEHEWPYG